MLVWDVRDTAEVEFQGSIWEKEEMGYETSEWPISTRVLKAIKICVRFKLSIHSSIST